MREVSTLGKAGQMASAAMDNGVEEVRARGRRARKQAAKQAAATRKQASRHGAALRKEAVQQLERARKEADKRAQKARKKAGKRAQQVADQLAESLAENTLRARRELAARVDPAPPRRRWPWLLLLLIVGGAAAAAVLARRPQEFGPGVGVTTPGQLPPRTPPVAPGPTTPSAARDDGAVDADHRTHP